MTFYLDINNSTTYYLPLLSLSLCRWGLWLFFCTVIGLLLSTKHGRQSFLDKGRHSQRQRQSQRQSDDGDDNRCWWLRWLPRLFPPSHRLVGAMHYFWLIYGTLIPTTPSTTTDTLHSYDRYHHPRRVFSILCYDVVLGILGIATTLTAARDFPHKHVLKRLRKNDSNHNRGHQSGTLSQHAIVTHEEMMEHAFYQGLNLLQAIYLHVMRDGVDHLDLLPPLLSTTTSSSWQRRFLALALATSPWLIRHRFPVHPFSQNWRERQLEKGSTTTEQQAGRTAAVETWMYRVKKAQYLFYKHVLLHGMNLAAFLQHNRVSSPTSTSTRSMMMMVSMREESWRLYWVCLNASYVMEFFLQSMVKRKALQQSAMLFLNRWLMAVSTVAACLVLWSHPLPWFWCVVSLLWNWIHRQHDFSHTMILAGLALLVQQHGSGYNRGYSPLRLG